jgi:VRR-NUC domain-containing protein/Fanconi-associated nuclease 1-like protein/Fanconi anemia protein nuclease-like protein
VKPESVSAELTPHYYRDNFLLLCDTIERQYGDLLAPPERALLDNFRRLDFQAQCLYVRLVSRVGPWFRESKLAYPELDKLPGAIDSLLAGDMLELAAALTVDEIGRLFTRAELRAAFAPLLPGAPAGDKAALLAAIEELALAPQALLQALTAIDTSRIVAPRGVEWVELLQLLFFGNRYQSLTEFVLSDLGITNYYPYRLDREHRLFPHRQALDEYLDCCACADNWYQLRDEGDREGLLMLAQEMLGLDIRFASSERRWYRLCNDLARDLERMDELGLAQQLYGASRLHPARERSARVLEAQGDWAGAAQLCEQILAAPWCEDERDAAGRILARARRRIEGGKMRRPREVFPQLKLELPQGSDRVEVQAALWISQQFPEQWRSVHYVENQLMNTLFGLAFWEQIFAPVPGAFHNPYQSVPADMYEAGFRLRRQPSLDQRLAQLRDADLRKELHDAYGRYGHYQCRWVSSRDISQQLVDEVSRLIPAAHLLAIWERMLFDPRENRRGFPDLIALGSEVGQYCMIEVKGPGDALQDSQKRWLRFFGHSGIPASVAWVTWLNSDGDD